MWINITKEIFDKAEFKSLNFLYQILSWYPSDSCSRYNVVIDTEKVLNTDNFKKLSTVEKSLKEFLDIEFTNFTNTNSNISYKISYEKKLSNFNIEEAIIFFNQPVSIVLENNKNDSQFILAIIKHFCDNEKIVFNHFNNGWIQFENAGGCSNIPNFIDGFLKKFKTIADKNNKKISDYFRGILIIDSDKEFDNQEFKHKALIEKLERLGLDTKNIIESTNTIINQNPYIHILEKRMMENYLPKEIFEYLRSQNSIQKNNELKDWLDVYCNLTDKKQLDYLNISDGFPPKKGKYDNTLRKDVNKEILKLFSLDVTDLNFQKLDKGFKFQGFDENGNLKNGSSFKEQFPNLFRKTIVNKKNLEIRDGNGELQIIANKIKNLL
jgi:uncharacterized protein with HEPN domain